MTTKVSDFLSKFKHGLAKPNRFLVSIAQPLGAPSANPEHVSLHSQAGNIQNQDALLNGDQGVSLLCHTVTLPPRALLLYDHKQLVGPYKVPYSQSYDPVTLSFYADGNLSARRYFDIWQAAVLNINSNTINYYEEFVQDVGITVLNDEGDAVYGINLFDAFPMNLGLVDLSYGNTNSYMSITVTLSYKYWSEVGSNTTKRG